VSRFLRTPEFDAWLKALRDPVAKGRVIARIRSAEAGNFGDFRPAGEGVSEMRIHVGPGYRLYYCRMGEAVYLLLCGGDYYCRMGEAVYLLLCGGDKSSQRRDIGQAIAILRRLENGT
jgi:putative addiction module killer protein